MFLLRLAHWLLYHFLANTVYKATTKFKNSPIKTNHNFPLHQTLTNPNLHNRESQSLVCDIHNCLLRSKSLFPFFMLVAFEGGSIFRAFFLLLSYPFLRVLSYETKTRVMILITFCGLRLKDMESVSKAVLPKFYLEDLNFQAYEVLSSVGFKVVVTSVPKVMVEGFLKEYLSVDSVIGTELHRIGEYFTGLVSETGLVVKHRAVKKLFGDKRPDIGIGSSSFDHHLLLSLCKESYVVNKDENKSRTKMPREKYPKPLIFHDGRLAFLPTPSAMIAMFIWLPLGILLALFRLFLGKCLPYNIAALVGAFSGVSLRVKRPMISPSNTRTSKKGVLYACTHRTLLDPIFLTASLAKPLTAVTYSLSKMSEMLAPIKTVRLTRDRKQDSETIQKLLSEGDLVICPEGTTCREPYLLRFSSLFAELADDDIVPVAMNTHVTMFYGTTASGYKWLDPIFFLMNPRPCYSVHILEKVAKEFCCGGGKSSHEVANYIQKKLGFALGFECTMFTRRDKYLMLAGNEGRV